MPLSSALVKCIEKQGILQFTQSDNGYKYSLIKVCLFAAWVDLFEGEVFVPVEQMQELLCIVHFTRSEDNSQTETLKELKHSGSGYSWVGN